MKKQLQVLIGAGFLMALLFSQIHAATAAEIESGSISGIVIDDSTAGPVSFASVALLNAADSSIITGVITNDLGQFQFEDLPYGKYNVKVTFVGYKPSVVKNIELSRQNRKVELNTLKLTEDFTTLNEAVIVGQRLKGEEKVDRTVYTLNDDIRKASSNGLDALKHIPSVSVDFQENVTLEGQSNIQFYVDGVLRNKDYVSTIKPEMIDKVELITNPGVKYDADVSGVINIVLKKEARYGMSGSVKVPIPHPQRIVADANANLEYGTKKFRLYAFDELHFERFEGKELLTTEVMDEENPISFEKRGSGINNWRFNYANYGIDYFINDKTSLNFMGEIRTFTGLSDGYKFNSLTKTGGELTQFLKTERNSLSRNDNYFFSLFFKRQLKKEGNDIRAELYYNLQAGKDKNNYDEVYLNTDDLVSVEDMIYRNEITRNQRNNLEFKIDATFSLKNIVNEAGARSYSTWMDNRFTNRYTIEEIESETIQDFSYLESRQIGYYNLSGKIAKFSWQAGVRGEYTGIEVEDTYTDYAVLLPQVSFSQSLPKEQSLKLTYRKQVFRPSVNNLNPFVQWMDSLHVRMGNPNLDPALENRIELTYSKNFKSNYISPKVYYRYTRNGIQDVTIVSDEGITQVTQDNIGRNMEYGIGLNAALQVMKRWRFNANVTVFNTLIRTDVATTGHSKEEMASYRFNFSQIITLPKDYTLFVFGDYRSKNISYQREFERDMLVIFGAEKKFNEKLSADVFYNPFIRQFKYSSVRTRTLGYEEYWEGSVDATQLFCFSIAYRFNRGGREISKIQRSVEYEKNESRGGL